ncbi:MAG: M16 family metallopeptidase [Verrucomicrobiales bacterium]
MRSNYDTCRMQNGMRLGFAPLPDSECTAVSIHIPAGSRDDPPHAEGLAHFAEHMIFKGTERRDAKAISTDVENTGASLDAFTSEDQTVYEARGDAETLPLLIDVLCDIVWHSTFQAHEIELEREVIAEEIVMYRETPSEHISDLLSAALWGDHPLGQPISGSLQSIQNIQQRDLIAFTERHYRREDVVIAVAGPHQLGEIVQLLESRLPTATPPVHPPRFEPIAGRNRSVLETRDTQQLQLALAYRSYPRTDPKRHALNLLAMILGEGASSRLFMRLREERGLCYQVSCHTSLMTDTGSLEIHAGLDPSSRQEALDCIQAEIDDLIAHGPDVEELARAKRLYASQSRAGMESTAAHASWAGDCLMVRDHILSPSQSLASILQVTAHEIQETAREVCVPDRFAIAEIGPPPSSP